MNHYTFGGSRFKKLWSHAYDLITTSGCGISRLFISLAKGSHRLSLRWRNRAKRIRMASEPTTIHITRIVPLDRWTLRIEFTENRKTKYCVHLESLEGKYAEMFANFKRGEEIAIADVHYYSVAGLQAMWKRML